MFNRLKIDSRNFPDFTGNEFGDCRAQFCHHISHSLVYSEDNYVLAHVNSSGLKTLNDQSISSMKPKI